MEERLGFALLMVNQHKKIESVAELQKTTTVNVLFF